MFKATTLQMVIPIVVILIVLGLRMRSLSRPRPLRLERLWIVPAIYLLITGMLFFTQPPRMAGWIAAAVALAVGAALGWQRGRMMHIEVDPETHEMTQKGSPAAMLFLVGLILVRTALREMALFDIGGLHIDVNLATEALVALALGLLSVQRIEMYLRGKRLLEEARAGKAA